MTLLTKEESKSYKESIKATSLIGGVQVFNIIIGILKSKFVAILLGPGGMGIFGLYTSTINLISTLTNCGLPTSAVRNIAVANANDNYKHVSIVIRIFRRLIWITGIIGTLICLCFARYFSNITFGNSEYSGELRILSVSILLIQLTSGQNTLLQGLRKYKKLALANLIGHGAALVIIVPMYYVWRMHAIVPSILIMYCITYIVAFLFSHQIQISKDKIPTATFKSEGGNMLKMGIFINLTNILLIISSYLIRIFIQREGGMEHVGFYTAAFTIINTYVGMVFTAMSTDYYPRLSAVAHDNFKMNKTINQQMDIALLIIAPIIALFIVFAKLGVIILYSKDFLIIEELLYCAILGIIFKATSWSIAYSFLSKGDTKAFFWNEFFSILTTFILNVIGYKFWGFLGLGISFFLAYMIYFIQVFIVCKIRYGFKIENKNVKTIIIQFTLLTSCVITKFFLPSLYCYFFGTFVFILLTVYSYKSLKDIINVKNILKRILHIKTTK